MNKQCFIDANRNILSMFEKEKVVYALKVTSFGVVVIVAILAAIGIGAAIPYYVTIWAGYDPHENISIMLGIVAIYAIVAFYGVEVHHACKVNAIREELEARYPEYTITFKKGVVFGADYDFMEVAGSEIHIGFDLYGKNIYVNTVWL